MNEVYCEVTKYIFADEELFVDMTGYGLIIYVLEERGESNGLVYGFTTELEFVVCAYNAELTWRFNDETYGELTFVVLVLYSGLHHPTSCQKMTNVLVIIGVYVFVEDF